jgi:protoheme IX farnesyltransferase
MPTHPIVATLDAPPVPVRRLRSSSVLGDYWQLTKPEINFLVVITTAAGFWIGTAAALPDVAWMSLLQSLLATALVAGGASTLNQVVELRYDAQMRRTARRPIASGRIDPADGLRFGVALAALGVTWLAVSTNALAALLAAVTLLLYLFVYTPLKRISPLCTLVGAIPGAAPPLIGWAAARGHLDPGAWALFAIVFLWQFPHFTPIAWMYREDYARAGYVVLPEGQSRYPFVMWQTVAAAVVLLGVGLLPTVGGLSGAVYFAGALALGGVLLLYSARFAIRMTNVAARELLIVSILYLPAIFLLLVLDKN